ncbi:MAG: AAA family ATPase, partial [Verrucomicrobiaceae bacterium]|nr:AAA family ATPase [Verrucomicrobiaceae bacterium]
MAETATQSQAELGSSDKTVIEELRSAYAAMREQLGGVIVGQDEVIEQLLISIFCRSHALLVGVPGLAKTLLISTLSEVLDLSFKRIQF